MSTPSGPNWTLENTKVDVKIKLSALWIATMLCYIYGDYFELYVPGKLHSMIDGKMLPLGPVTQGMLIGTSTMMATQALMAFFSLVAPPALNRWLNVVFGLVSGLIVAMVITQGGWMFYKLLGVVEIALLMTLVRLAWTWPRCSLSLETSR
ncbi:DUF6326 family protein [Massilia sp. S19_KUP03_FR1]|uniref:DUF6326 family protein n=1 Tax=Massilia sp. S19_KUP03_FR1 TaxID=3025503 RepID=UPI002FCDCE5A